MSLHNAKGLEYDAAFIIGCEEGVFPHARSVEEGNLEEERRLAYVGVTRAKQRLYMTCARRRSLHGSSGWNLPSRFLREVPDELTEKKAMAVQTGWQGARAGGSRRDTVLGFGGAASSALRSDQSHKRPRSSSGSATTSSTPASARASSLQSSRAAWWSSASRPRAASAS